MQPAPSKSQAVRVNGLTLNLLDFAAASPEPAPPPGEDPRPKLLCLHGGAAHAHWFDFVAAEFTERCRVLSLDLRGHGDSDWAAEASYAYQDYASDVAAVIDSLGIAPVVLVGHSMGGMVSLVTSARYPDRVATLVVIDSMMQMTPDRVSTLRGVGRGKGRSFETREAYVRGFKIRPEGSSAAPEVIRHMAEHACRRFEDGLWRNKFDRKVYATRHPIDGYEYWSKVRAPALLVAGGESDRITPPVLERVRAVCPHVERRVVEGAGHHVTLDNPSGFRAAVGGYLASGLPAPAAGPRG